MDVSENGTRSTKGASKQRREQINVEIDRLKDLLPLPQTVRQRIFQLQIMSLTCIYIRRQRYLPYLMSRLKTQMLLPELDVFSCLNGFGILVTHHGKLLYISENVVDHWGHSAVEIMSQGDSLYDLVDVRDHEALQRQLLNRKNFDEPSSHRRVMCRLNLTRAAKRQPHHQKYIVVEGCFIYSPLGCYPGLSAQPWIQPIFAAICTPLITQENVELLTRGSTMIFNSVHAMDLKFLDVDEICLYHLGYTKDDLKGASFYTFIHPMDVQDVSNKHKLLCQEKESTSWLLVRIQTQTGAWIWLYTILALKFITSRDIGDCVHNDGDLKSESGDKRKGFILATHQMLSAAEATTLKKSLWFRLKSPKLCRSALSTSVSVKQENSRFQDTLRQAHTVPYQLSRLAMETTALDEPEEKQLTPGGWEESTSSPDSICFGNLPHAFPMKTKSTLEDLYSRSGREGYLPIINPEEVEEVFESLKEIKQDPRFSSKKPKVEFYLGSPEEDFSAGKTSLEALDLPMRITQSRLWPSRRCSDSLNCSMLFDSDRFPIGPYFGSCS